MEYHVSKGTNAWGAMRLLLLYFYMLKYASLTVAIFILRVLHLTELR